MNEDQTVAALGALAHAQRLRVFRALVVAGPDGLTPSVMAGQLDVARNALSFHLKELSHAGLVSVEQRGRNLIYRADFARMRQPAGLSDRALLPGRGLRGRQRPPPGPAKTAKHPLSTARKSQAEIEQ